MTVNHGAGGTALGLKGFPYVMSLPSKLTGQQSLQPLPGTLTWSCALSATEVSYHMMAFVLSQGRRESLTQGSWLTFWRKEWLLRAACTSPCPGKLCFSSWSLGSGLNWWLCLLPCDLSVAVLPSLAPPSVPLRPSF